MVKYFSPLPYYRKLTLHKINANFLFALIYVALIFVTYSFFHFIHSFIHSFARSLMNSFIHSFIHSFLRIFIHSFVSSIYSLTDWLIPFFPPFFAADSRVRRSLRSSASSSRSSRAPYHASQRGIRRSASSSSLGSMAGIDHGDRVDEEHSEQSENALSGNILKSASVNKVPFIHDVFFVLLGCRRYGLLGTLSDENVDVPDVKNGNRKLIFSLFHCSDSTNSYSGT